MKKFVGRLAALLMTLIMATALIAPAAYASEAEDPVAAVIAQLEAIDTLQEMQNKRSSYTAASHYDITTTDTAIITKHEAARSGYEAYVAEMFAARIAAQLAYDALSAEQQAQIDASLVAKLSNELPTLFRAENGSVTPSDDEYTFEAVKIGTGYAYEVSTHMVSGQIPQTFVLVDTSNGDASWTPNGLYVFGESNYEVAYCSDVETGLAYGTDYKRINLEDSSYYGADAASHIRAILLNSYPYVSIDEMKAKLISGGLNAAFVDTLTRADMIAAVQMAVWAYANAADVGSEGLRYFASINVPKNDDIYFHPMHDYTNECWEWQPGKKQRTFDARAEYRVNTLAYYLINLPGEEASDDEIVISDVQVTRAQLLPDDGDMYQLGMYIYFNGAVDADDDLTVSVVSYHTNEDGTTSVTGRNAQQLGGRTKVDMTVNAAAGDTIEVVIEGTQYVEKGVYFYEPEGGRDASQNLVGVGSGETRVRAEETFLFAAEDYETGLRIYKTELGTGLPLSDITFTLYRVTVDSEVGISSVPTEQELAAYKTEENKVAAIVTDETGYASVELEEGTYLIVEEYNADKIKAPVSPFYIQIPMTETKENGDGTTTVETINLVSVYPKNETVPPVEPPPVVPPIPDTVKGQFEILKYDAADSSKVLADAQFEVYRPATVEDTDTQIIMCDGVQYAVVPVTVGGEKLVLTTDENGKAGSPELECGTYFLVEIKAPAGYNLPDETFSVTVVSSEMTEITTVKIANQRGAMLPETGGQGTIWFSMTGTALIIAAVLLLAARKRMLPTGEKSI